jgi:tripartite motif-containing protein 2/3/tripartite motif-containing protein 71
VSFFKKTNNLKQPQMADEEITKLMDIKRKESPVGVVKELERPWGVTMDNGGNIYVVESEKHQVTVCNEKGDKTGTIGSKGFKQGELTDPLGITLTKDNHLIVVDRIRIQKFDLKGQVICSASTRKANFTSAFAVAINPLNDKLYLVDNDKHSVIVLNDNMSPAFSFGTNGTGEGQLNKPRDIAINSHGVVYVVDNQNDRVCMFDQDGGYIASIEGDLDRPSSIAIDKNDFVYVAEIVNGRVFVFDPKNELVHCFGKCGSGHGEYSGPRGIHVDDNGTIIISDTYNNRLVII